MKGKKTGGRKAGKPNATTSKAKELILAAIDLQTEDFNKTMLVIKKDNPIEWAKLMCKLFDYVLPKKVDLDVKTDGEKITSWLLQPVKQK